MQFDQLKRREFISVLGGAAAWPLAVQAQGVRRVAVVLGFAEGDQEGQARLTAFVEALARLGWNDRRNVLLDVRWAGGNLANYKSVAREVIAGSPDVIAAMTNPFVSQLQLLTKSIPIVFIQVSGSVGAGFVSNVARPGGNITGFENFQPETGGKWLELLKDAVPEMTRVGILLQPENSSLAALRQVIEAAAPKLAVQATAIGVHDTADIQRGITACAEQPNGGLIVLADPLTIRNRDLIIVLAARYRLPYSATIWMRTASGDQGVKWRPVAAL